VLSRGLIGGGDAQYGPSDYRAHTPRFTGANLIRNRDLLARLTPIADRLGLTVPELAIAWAAGQGADIVPVIGMRKRSRLDAAVRAASTMLTAEALAAVDAAVSGRGGSGRALRRGAVRGAGQRALIAARKPVRAPVIYGNWSTASVSSATVEVTSSRNAAWRSGARTTDPAPRRVATDRARRGQSKERAWHRAP
jgi:hypothetical protein